MALFKDFGFQYSVFLNHFRFDILRNRALSKNGGNYMEQIWKEMFQAAKAVQNGRQISDYVDTGELLPQYYHHQEKYMWVSV